jgi:exosortase
MAVGMRRSRLSTLTPHTDMTLDRSSAPVLRHDEAPSWLGLTPVAWFKIAIVAVLMIVTFRFNLVRLWLKTNPVTGEPNWGHSIVVPIIGLYYLYLNREELLKAPVQPLLAGRFTRGRLISVAVLLFGAAALYLVGPSVLPSHESNLKAAGVAWGILGALVLLVDWGLGALLFGLLTFAYGIWPGQNDFLKDFGMVMTLFGVVLMLTGWQVMKIAWFPIVFLICALPWPGLVYSWVAGPLQALAAHVAVATLQITGVAAEQAGTKIHIGDGFTAPIETLNVAEACAGMRSLMTFISVGAAMAFLSSRPLWQRLFITFMAIPIAIFCNVMRVTGQGLIHQYWSKEMATGFAHTFVGMVMLIPAFFLILLVCWILDQIFVEEVDAGHSPHVIRRTPARAVVAGTSGAGTEGGA